ncbi:putative glutamine-serine-proline rich protein [Aspergillus homomorphus CBS 101889]|uniref:CNVH-domain-containing protein n=1 Tax=Aspergillus homomorphus (strain CBS 101889) TaxID=1450537 RepID=A0A395HMV0_ASPHC|nr:CNVH-domain-containing protein [Aspergillus homomorphus CBS 101889]RAL09262.1 CNVH-domain-containing protein [Aspergillus homomorphus CBS 101889]
MSAQEYFGGSQQPKREETHTPGPWSSSTPGPDTPRTGAYSPYPPSQPNYENYYRPNSNPSQNYYAPSPDPTRTHSPYQTMPAHPSFAGGPSPSPSLGGDGYSQQQAYGQQQQQQPPYPHHGGPPNPSYPYPQQEGGNQSYGNDRPYSPYPPTTADNQSNAPYNQLPGGPQQPPPYTSNPNLPPGATDDQDRGFLGAVTGGAAGAFAGHKVNHGFLGAIGGALTGSVAEDAVKKHRKKKEEEEKEALRRQHEAMKEQQRREHEAMKEQQRREKEERKMQRRANRHNRHSSSSSSSSSSDDDHHHRKHHGKHCGGGTYRGNFSGSSRDIRLEGYHELVAYCGDVNGHQHRSSIPLNDVLTNSWGELKWARHGNFAASASNVHLEDGGRVLVADLGDGNAGWKRSFIRLDERISNQNGRLVFLD